MLHNWSFSLTFYTPNNKVFTTNLLTVNSFLLLRVQISEKHSSVGTEITDMGNELATAPTLTAFINNFLLLKWTSFQMRNANSYEFSGRSRKENETSNKLAMLIAFFWRIKSREKIHELTMRSTSLFGVNATYDAARHEAAGSEEVWKWMTHSPAMINFHENWQMKDRGKRSNRTDSESPWRSRI